MKPILSELANSHDLKTAWRNLIEIAIGIGISGIIETKFRRNHNDSISNRLDTEVIRTHFEAKFYSEAKLMVARVPVGLSHDAADISFVTFFAETSLGQKSRMYLNALAFTYAGKVAQFKAETLGNHDVSLRPSELECIRWAIEGKTLQDIAEITGISYRTVRYHIDQARNRYGFATNLQLYVQAALDYGLDPLISLQQIRGVSNPSSRADIRVSEFKT